MEGGGKVAFMRTIDKKMHYLSGLKPLAGVALATVSVLALVLHVSTIESSTNHSKTARKPLYWARGGGYITAEEAYGLLYDTPVRDPKDKPTGKYGYYFPTGLDDVSLGYGLYFRRPGYMLVHIKNVLSGAKNISGSMSIKGHYIHYNEKDHHAQIESNEPEQIKYLPYRLTDIKHLLTYPRFHLAVIRVSMDDFADTFTPADGKPPYNRYQDYPGDDSLPEIANLTDQREICYVISHNYFDGDQMGYNEYSWRWWAVRPYWCDGPRCRMGAARKHDTTYVPRVEDDNGNIVGRICDIQQDKGTPIICHTQKKRLVVNGRVAKLSDGGWKLAYWVGEQTGRSSHCYYDFYAVNLAYYRDQLLNPGWDQFLEGGLW